MLKAQRAYTGEHMRAVYTDGGRSQFFNVENLALKYYGQHEGWNGLHVENQLMRLYFGVFFWDEIFYDRVPFVFQTPYQFGPLDFERPEFYETRKEIIEAKLEQISKMNCLELRDYFEHTYDLHKNVHNPLVNWDNLKLTKQRCGVILKCMGAKVLTMFLKRLAKDFVQWRFGMPDLILWREARPP